MNRYILALDVNGFVNSKEMMMRIAFVANKLLSLAQKCDWILGFRQVWFVCGDWCANRDVTCSHEIREMKIKILLVDYNAVLVGVLGLVSVTSALQQQPLDRRHFVAKVAAATSAAETLQLSCLQPATAATITTTSNDNMEPNGLASRLVQRNPNLLRNKVFNIPPGPQVFPPWMRGTWHMQVQFSGYLFPSRNISRQRLTADYDIPGFRKCSIAPMADVGKDQVSYTWTIDEDTGWEDRTSNLQHAIDAYLGYPAVHQVLYNARKNPNRMSIDFNDYRTVNAERIELFCNARESEEYTNAETGTPIFVHSEYMRQVTFGTGSTYGVPRQVGTNYGLFWTWKRTRSSSHKDNKDDDDELLTGNLLTAAYLDPQDALYFEEPVSPVVVYSNVFQARRRA